MTAYSGIFCLMIGVQLRSNWYSRESKRIKTISVVINELQLVAVYKPSASIFKYHLQKELEDFGLLSELQNDC